MDKLKKQVLDDKKAVLLENNHDVHKLGHDELVELVRELDYKVYQLTEEKRKQSYKNAMLDVFEELE